MQKKSLACVIVLWAASMTPMPLCAQSHHHFEDKPHHLSLLSAETYMSGHGPSRTLGLDYEYRISAFTGLGFVLEHAFDELDATTALAVADLHLHRGLVMQVGPGYEFSEHHDYFVSRVGLIYEFDVAGFNISPQLHWDYHHGGQNAVVAGFSLGFGF